MNKQNTNYTGSKPSTLINGLSVAGGAIAGGAGGAFLGSKLAPEHKSDEDIDEQDEKSAKTDTDNNNEASNSLAENHASEKMSDEDFANQEIHAEVDIDNSYPEEAAAFNPVVTDYQDIVYDDGSMIEVAVVEVNNTEIGVIDVDMDGEADLLVADLNNDGIIGINEMEVIAGEGVDMQQFADALDPMQADNLAANDMPDYVDDANVDGFLA